VLSIRPKQTPNSRAVVPMGLPRQGDPVSKREEVLRLAINIML